MPLWYVLREAPSGEPGPRLWSWTYAASQKVRNLERDTRASVQVEAGELYHELRGVMLECEVAIHRDTRRSPRSGGRSSPATPPRGGRRRWRSLPAEVGEMVDRQAPKRVALEFCERRRASWDHRKLGGVY